MRIEIPQLNKNLDFEIPSTGLSLLVLLVSNKIPLGHSCGGDGVCGTCWVELEGEGLPMKGEAAKKLWKKQFPKKPLMESQYFACLVNLTEKDSSKTWVLRCPSW